MEYIKGYGQIWEIRFHSNINRDLVNDIKLHNRIMLVAKYLKNFLLFKQGFVILCRTVHQFISYLDFICINRKPDTNFLTLH